MSVKENLPDAAANLLRLRKAAMEALAQADGIDATAILDFMKAEADAHGIKRDNRRAELERKLSEIQSGLAASRTSRAK